MVRVVASCLLSLLATAAWSAAQEVEWDLRQRASYLFGYAQLGPAVIDGRMLPELVVAGIQDAAGGSDARVPVDRAKALYQRWSDERDAAPAPEQSAVGEDPAAWSLQQQISYLFGYLPLTRTIAESRLDVPTLVAGLREGATGVEARLDPEAARAVFADYERQLAAERGRAAQQAAAANQRHLAEVAARDGAVATASGLVYEVLEPGEGPLPGPHDRVRVHYTGRLVDGTVFDSSVERGEPAIFHVDGVIAGWTEALQLMKVGARYRLHIPPDLGYGERGAGEDIPPGAVLVFEVELLGIE